VNNQATVTCLFNNYFSRIVVNLTKDLKPQNSISGFFSNISDTTFVSEPTSYKILKIIGRIKNKYSASLNEFPDFLLKY